jgi:hypothetical protein
MRPAHDINAHSLPHIIYSVRSDTAPEMALSTLANVYRFVLDRQATKEAAPESRPDDGTKIKEYSANEHNSR